MNQAINLKQPPSAIVTDHLDIWTSAIRNKSSAGRGSGSKRELYGIKKLRELILDLAVRGLLVPQDPSDEPASELLKRIAAEKARLVKEGNLRNQKTLTPINDGEKPFNLLNGWEFARLGDVVFNRDCERIPLSVEERKNRKGSFDYYGASGVIDSIDDFLFDKPLLLIGEDGANLVNRSTPIAFMAYGKYWVNNHAHVLDSLSQDILNYVCIHINAISLEPYITGTAQPKMNQAKMNSIVLAVPPAKEQKRIVDKVDELMALCDQLEQQTDASLTAHETLVETLLGALTSAQNHDSFQQAWQRIDQHFDTLFTTEDSIDQLKQTILQLAVMGKLVPQDPNDEPASELLKKIAAEKARLVKEGKIKKQKPLPPISDKEMSFTLPDGWSLSRLGFALNKITDGTHHSPPNGESGEYLYISAKNIKNDGVQLSNATYVSREIHEEIYSRCDPERGDILYIKDGATTGVVTINNISEPFSMLSSVALLKSSMHLSNDYLLVALRSPLFYKEMRAGMTGVAITRVTLKKLEHSFIPIPPLSEQERIVAKVDELVDLCDQLKARLNQTQSTQLHLADALTKQAVE